MANALFSALHPVLNVIGQVPATRGPLWPNYGTITGRGRLSTDAVGTCEIMFQNVVIGSRYRIEVASTGASVADGIAAAANFSIMVPRYPAGNPSNTLSIKVRKASESPYYRSFETQIVAQAAPQSAYILQQLDE